MVQLLWDQPGEHFYETGLDRGVLYLNSGLVVPWNGLTSVSEDVSGNTTIPHHSDGIKYLDEPILGEFSGTLKAITYPDEFLECEGVLNLDGMLIDSQTPTRFGLSYRTQSRNELDLSEPWYKIHILYNLTAVSDSRVYDTLTSTINPMEFAWTISGVPARVSGYRPTSYVVLDLSEMHPLLIQDLEAILYGTETTSPRLPSLSELVQFQMSWALLKITDHGDGTWSAEDHGEYITMVDSTTFQINAVNATYLDGVTYEIMDTQA